MELESERREREIEIRARAPGNKNRLAAPGGLANPDVAADWEGLQTAMTALEAANATLSRPLYRAAIALVVTRAAAFAQAARALSEALEE